MLRISLLWLLLRLLFCFLILHTGANLFSLLKKLSPNEFMIIKMDFSSLAFLFVFFPIFISVYLLAKPSLRLFLISVANIFFIATGQYITLLWLIGITLTGYAVGRLIETNKKKGLKTSWLVWFGIGVNLGLLIIFKLLATYGINPVFKMILLISVVSLRHLDYHTSHFK